MSPVYLKVYGCGSAGMHLAHAARTLDWQVDMVDIDPAACERVPAIYAARYGAWDRNIGVYDTEMAPTDEYDICVIATPPATHIRLAVEAWERHNPAAVLVEKPLCAPFQVEEARCLLGTRTFVGYTHLMTAGLFNLRHAGYLQVDFMEAWKHVLNAHPWNAKPEDTYLGSWRAGGGGISEHSHAINLWEYMTRPYHGEVERVEAQIGYAGAYDETAWIRLTTEDGWCGYVHIDTVTTPARKLAFTVQADDGRQEQRFGKCDFAAELRHVHDMARTPSTSLLWTESPIAFDKGFRTARIIAACHRAHVDGRAVWLVSP